MNDSSPTLPTRGAASPNYVVITPENWVNNALPFFEAVVVRPMATPRSSGARLGQYLLDFEPAGRTTRPVGAGFENFLYQLDGETLVETAERSDTLVPHDFCYLPEGVEFSLKTTGAAARTLWTKRRYEAVEGVDLPHAIYGRLADVPDIVPPAPGDYVYRELIPTGHPEYDMAMNVLTCQPGGSIGLVEIHHQEHGLLMLEGQGVYYLAGDCHEVRQDDFIYMAPYCPQSFWATVRGPASYLLYKDVNRDGF